MKRLLAFAAFVFVAGAASNGLLAQSNPFVGTWKLNPAKSKLTSAPPKEEMVSVQMVGDQDQITVNGTAADGSPISYKYEVPDEGGAGRFLAGPFDAVSGKRIDNNTFEVSYTKGGKEMMHFNSVVSKDGKTMRNTLKGTNAQAILFLVWRPSKNNSVRLLVWTIGRAPSSAGRDFPPARS